MIVKSHLRIRLLCLIIIGVIVNVAQPAPAAAEELDCGGCVPYCSSTPDDWCMGCPNNAATCTWVGSAQCGVYSWFVNCNPI